MSKLVGAAAWRRKALPRILPLEEEDVGRDCLGGVGWGFLGCWAGEAGRGVDAVGQIRELMKAKFCMPLLLLLLLLLLDELPLLPNKLPL